MLVTSRGCVTGLVASGWGLPLLLLPQESSAASMGVGKPTWLDQI